jgi:ferredoxin
MTYVINEPCIGNKDVSCTEVCPVDCIHPTPGEPDFDEHAQLYIDPDACIDCDACLAACPVDAITPADQVAPERGKYIEINAAYYRRVRTVMTLIGVHAPGECVESNLAGAVPRVAHIAIAYTATGTEYALPANRTVFSHAQARGNVPLTRQEPAVKVHGA